MGGPRLSVAPEAQIELEIGTRPEQEITTYEEGLGAARPFPADTDIPVSAGNYSCLHLAINRNKLPPTLLRK